MSDSPPRDPKIAEAGAPNAPDAQNPSAEVAPNAAGAPGAARAAMSSNLQYLLKQPSTPWIMFGGDTGAEKSVGSSPDSLDADWGDSHAGGSAASSPSTPKAPVDVPPPPAYLLAVVDEVLSQSRPPPADPGPADAPREARVYPAPLITPAYLMPPVDSPVHVARPGVHLAPSVHVATLPQDFSPRASAPPVAAFEPPLEAPIDEPTELTSARKKSPILFIAIAGAAFVVLAIFGVMFLVLRSPASPAASSSAMTTAPTTSISVASAVSSLPPSDKVTLPTASASAPVAVVDDAPAASATVAAVATSAPSAAPVSAIDPKTGAKRASYLTIPRAASKHHVFLDGKLMLGNGARSFPVKCGEHTLAIDDRKATRVINVTCGGEYVVTN